MSSLDTQVGGNHYKSAAIQPLEFIVANGLGFCEANIVKYATRYGSKNGVEDLQKVEHYIQLHYDTLHMEPWWFARVRQWLTELFIVGPMVGSMIEPNEYFEANGITDPDAQTLIAGVLFWRQPSLDYNQEAMLLAVRSLIQKELEKVGD